MTCTAPKACPADHVTGFDVGFIIRHIDDEAVQHTKVLVRLNPLLEVCGRDSVVARQILVNEINASCLSGIRISQEVHTITRVGSMAVRSGTLMFRCISSSV